MEALLEPLLELSGYQRILEAMRTKNTPVLVTGVIDVEQIHLLYGVCHHTNRPAVIITDSELKAKQMVQDLLFFTPKAMHYPAKDVIFYSADVHSKDIIKERFLVMDAVIKGEAPIIVLSVEALFDRLTPREIFESFILQIQVGEILPLELLKKKLIAMGYERTDLVEAPGQFSVRGGIFDLFSPTEENPIRIEFWDEEIDSIRVVDALSQRSIEMTEKAKIFPMQELIYTEELVPSAVERLEAEFQKSLKVFQKKGMTEEIENLQEHIGEAIEKLRREKHLSDAANFISFFYEHTESLLQYLPKDTILFFDEPQRVAKHAETVTFEFSESITGRIHKGYMLPSQKDILFSYGELLQIAEKLPVILFTTITQSIPDFKPRDIVHFEVRASSSFGGHLELFCEELMALKKDSYRTVILAGGQTRCERLLSELRERGVEAAYAPELSQTSLEKGTIVISTGRLWKGFSYLQNRFAIFSEKELFSEGKKRPKGKKKKKGLAIESFTDLHIGDYVVHDNHGIGVFQGLEKITVDSIHKDYLKISYADGGNLFVPVNQMDLIQKYIGSDAASPKLSKLGGQDWSKAKTKVRQAVAILAEDLVKLYAKRQAAKGFVYSKDNIWQKEFEETFPYEETEDQLGAIEDVKRDMESSKVMDRLICGDVGYGKTEVAIRAAFKAVQDGKQVAYLVPTTILAQQHYNTFTERMCDYPIRVDMLSRFCTPKQQRETIDALEKGYVDIVIGTHRILSKDLKFKDLGLIIVDEEQRFGVSHKEKLKAMKEDVDVLTLTATPIPRTLHMSLSGIRDMSILEEPPLERHPVQTYVMEYSPDFVRDAIHRELSRGGQAYYLHNRVTNISEEANRLQNLVPEASIGYAHGQMTERELESVMKDFIEGELDVLVCTTIIETGLDITNVNTIIIQDADKMGLSQLYQLRGRVGRSNRIAYAYLMYKKDKVLEEVAEKRLQTIKEFTEFGSGFKVAMRDLELRGAGNLLGAEQHGHMESVGYEMYCKLLDESVRERRGEEIAPDFETTMDINVNAYIPDFYIKNEEQRLEIYKKIAQISTEEEYFDIQEEIEDRYGNLPKSVQMLLEVVLLKAQAHKLEILAITQKQKNLIVTFKGDAKIPPEAITALVMQKKNEYLFTAAPNPYITIKMKKEEGPEALLYIKNLLQAFPPFL